MMDLSGMKFSKSRPRQQQDCRLSPLAIRKIHELAVRHGTLAARGVTLEALDYTEAFLVAAIDVSLAAHRRTIASLKGRHLLCQSLARLGLSTK